MRRHGNDWNMDACRRFHFADERRLHKPAADRQSKPGSAEFACDRAISLGESFKNQGLFVFWNSDAAIGDGEEQSGATSFQFIDRNANLNLSFGRELQCIADQIDQYL